MSDTEKYIEYSRDEIDSLHGGILRNKIFCHQCDFNHVDAKRLTKGFHTEEDMFEWVNKNAAEIYVLLKERVPDVFCSYFARVLLYEIHNK